MQDPTQQPNAAKITTIRYQNRDESIHTLQVTDEEITGALSWLKDTGKTFLDITVLGEDEPELIDPRLAEDQEAEWDADEAADQEGQDWADAHEGYPQGGRYF